MSRLRHADVLVELMELCQDLMQEIRQQLAYYRASVYKSEASAIINTKVEQLRLVSSLLGDDPALEQFKDYDAMCKMGAMHYIPGECSVSKRVSSLLAGLEGALAGLQHRLVNRGAQSSNPQEFVQTFMGVVRKHRQELLALCRHGSRQWSIFQSI